MEPLRDVELRHLRWAIIASQHRSLRQAADALNVRQSTLSRCIRDLEYRLDAALFDRTSGGTRPTLAGQEFLDAARGIVEDAEAVIRRLKARARGESGRITTGVHASLSAGNLRATLIDFRRRFPDVETCLVDGSGDHLISNLANSTLLHESGGGRSSAISLHCYGRRTYSGRPSSSIRFSALTAISTSVARRRSVHDRSPSPMTRLKRLISASTSARQL
jgi:hypothetical protein